MSEKTAGAEMSFIDRVLQTLGLQPRAIAILQPDVQPLGEDALQISVPRNAPPV